MIKYYIKNFWFDFLAILIALIFIFLAITGKTFADVNQNNFTSTRSYGTTYQNTSGYPKFVSVASYDNVGWSQFGGASSSPSISGGDKVSTCGISSTTVYFYCSVFFVVPNNYYYEVVTTVPAPTIQEWLEWDMASTTSAITVNNSTTTNSFLGIATSTNGSTTTLQVDIANQDYFYGIIIFMLSMYFIIWFFRKK